MRKLVEKLSMTRRWATDSRHITQRGGMYWSYSSTHLTCSSGQGWEHFSSIAHLRAQQRARQERSWGCCRGCAWRRRIWEWRQGSSPPASAYSDVRLKSSGFSWDKILSSFLVELNVDPAILAGGICKNLAINEYPNIYLHKNVA